MEDKEVKSLKRLTTMYDSTQDRIRLTGADDQSQAMCLWLTQRLLNRLAPYLCKALDGQLGQPQGQGGVQARVDDQALRRGIEQSFAQQRARAALPRQPPVSLAEDSPQWLVDTVDVKAVPGGVRLVFKGEAELDLAMVTMPSAALRQWLGIVYEQYRHGGWSTQVWPIWMEEAAVPPAKKPSVPLH